MLKKQLFSVFVCGALIGCGVPPHMRVASGVNPENIDKEVRYRTTYYVRSFDYCYNRDELEDSSKTRLIIPETDTLLRYTMTGKANALTTKIHFESGVLDAATIDPFGAKLIFDEEGGFHVQTAKETKAKAKQRDAFERYTALLKQYQEVIDLGTNAPAGLKESLEKAIQRAVNEYTGTLPDEPDPSVNISLDQIAVARKEGDKVEVRVHETETKTTVTKKTSIYSGKLPAEGKEEVVGPPPVEVKPQGTEAASFVGPENTKIACPDDGELTVRRGFQIMGPEGIKTFDQDDRLVLAMSIDGQPLISTMNRYSSRVLNATAAPADALLPIVREDLATAQAEQARKLRLAESPTPSVEQSFDSVLEAFDPASADKDNQGQK